jgi:hypothetical protein
VTAPGHGEVTVVGDETMGEKDPLLAKLLAAATAGASPAGPANPRKPLHSVPLPTGRLVLSAWSLYLTKFPSGQLAPEARYSRAICLVQLGRVEGAKAALAELDATAPAEHLRTQARRLLERLSSR